MDAASLPAHVRVIGAVIDERDRAYIAQKLGMKLGRFAASVERITVRLSDANGPKGGLDQNCQVKVVLSGMPSVVVRETDSTLRRTIDRAIDSAARGAAKNPATSVETVAPSGVTRARLACGCSSDARRYRPCVLLHPSANPVFARNNWLARGVAEVPEASPAKHVAGLGMDDDVTHPW
jgi:hypothetical protein